MAGKGTARIHWSKALWKEPGNYIGWPTIARRADGDVCFIAAGGDEDGRAAEDCGQGRCSKFHCWSPVTSLAAGVSPLFRRSSIATVHGSVLLGGRTLVPRVLCPRRGHLAAAPRGFELARARAASMEHQLPPAPQALRLSRKSAQ